MNNNFIPNLSNNNDKNDDNSNNQSNNLIPNLSVGDNENWNNTSKFLSNDSNSNDVNTNFTTISNNEESPNKLSNPYRDYLPENRESNGFNIPPKVMKFSFGMFWVMVICVVCLIGLKYFSGVDVFEIKSRNYNLNLTETINLDNIYSSPDVVWESDSDNVTIKNNVVLASKTGSAYILGRIGDQQVSDVKVNVLSEDVALSLENHSVSLSVGENTTIKVNSNLGNSSQLSSNNSNLVANNGGTVSDTFSSVGDYYFEDDILEEEDDDEDYSDYKEYYDETIPEIDDDSSVDDSDNTVDDTGDGEVIDNENRGDDEADSDVSDDMNSSDKDFEYKSSDDSIAKVDDKGNVTPVSPGTVIITVKDSDGNTDHTYVTVEDDDLVLQNTSYSLNENDSIMVDYSIKGSKYKSSDIVWSSSNLDVCSVDSKGMLFGKSEGKATITAKMGDKIQKTFSVVVNKNKVLPTSLSLSVSELNLFVSESGKISATVLPSDALSSQVSYSSKNENIVSVDENGIVVGKSVGNTVITVSTVNGIKKTVNVVVSKKIIPVNKVSFKESSVDLKVGKTIKLDYSIEPSSATDKSVQFNYDKNMVSIDENGVLKAIKPGNTSVELVSSNGIKTSLSVKISSNNVEVTQINLAVSTINLEVGKTKKIDYTILPNNATNKEITYLADNDIVSVDKSGVVKALKVGKSHISLQSNNGIISVLTVNVVSPKEVIRNLVIMNGNFTMNNGTSKQLEVTVDGDNIQSTKVWTVGNSNVLQIDSGGKVTAKNIGESTVTLKMGEKSSSIKIKVVNPTIKVNSISVNRSSTTIKMGSKEKLTASIKPSNATNKGISWKSDNKNIAKVSAYGTITGISKGQTTITVSSNDNKSILKKIKVNVTAAADSSKLSNLENAKSYKSVKVLKTLTTKNLKEELTIKFIGDFSIGQSFTATSDYYITTLINCPNRSEIYDGRCSSNNTKVLFYDRKTKKLVKSLTKKLGHTNGITHNPKTKMIYTSTPTYGFSYRDVSKIDKVELKKMSWRNKAIAYDTTTDQYYLVNRNKVTDRNEIYVYDADFNFIKKFAMIRSINQDCAAYKGLALCVKALVYPERVLEKTDGSIDIYRVSNNAYVGTINVNTMDLYTGNTYGIEIEDVAYLGGGKFGLYYNYSQHFNNIAAQLYTTTDFPIS